MLRMPMMRKITRPLNPVWHRMVYSCTHMATVGVKGLKGPGFLQTSG